MKTFGTILLLGAVGVNLVLVLMLWRGREQGGEQGSGNPLPVFRQVPEPAVAVEPAPAGDQPEGNLPPDVGARIAALEGEIAELRDVVSNLDIGEVLEERQAVFASDDGRAKADEFFEMGQFATAGEGYLTFLRKFPDHPDTETILKRASDAFRRAGYTDKSLWVYGSMIEAFPENRGDNLADLARMELEAKRYDDAITHAGEAAELADTVDEKYWRLLYRAWYVQERDGTAAGVAAYQEVQDSLAAEGLAETPMFSRAEEKRVELEKRLK